MNQTNAVLEHLKSGHTITSIEAFEMFGATRLSALIYVLRDRGYKIVTCDKVIVNRYGDKRTYAEYRLITEEGEAE